MSSASLEQFYQGGPKTLQEAFPPACLRTHWDPSALANHVLPHFPNSPQLAYDPRPAAKICTAYYTTSAGDGPLNHTVRPVIQQVPSALLGGRTHSTVSQSRVYPPGGAARTGFPYAAYAQHIQAESDLLWLDEPLTKCAEKRFLGPPVANVSHDGIPGADSKGLSPYATLVNVQAGCRNEDDNDAWNRSSRLFFNPTRYDRVKDLKRGPLAC